MRLSELSEERKKLSQQANDNNILGMLVFSSEIKDNQIYYNELQNKLEFDIANHEIDIQDKLVKKDEILKTLDFQKQGLQTRLNNLKDTIILKEPSYLKTPVAPKAARTFFLGGIGGFMMSVFLALFIEYLGKIREV